MDYSSNKVLDSSSPGLGATALAGYAELMLRKMMMMMQLVIFIICALGLILAVLE